MMLKPTAPTLLLSDLHLGHRASRVKSPEQIAPLLDRFETIVFNGDTSEMRHANDRPLGRRLAAELARLCHSLGTKAIFLNGNHDPTISELNHLDLEDGAVLVTHGDILFLGVAPWSRQAREYLKAHQEILQDLGPEGYTDFEKRLLASKRTALRLQMIEKPTPAGRLPFFELIARHLWPPTRPLTILRAWQQTPGLAAELARVFRPEARFIVIGHTHWPGCWKKGSRLIINCGSFFPHLGARAVILEHAALEVRSVDARRNQFVLGRCLSRYRIEKLSEQDETPTAN
jgi:predicted phosphodiesterase